jgi:triosephosphate isomerase
VNFYSIPVKAPERKKNPDSSQKVAWFRICTWNANRFVKKKIVAANWKMNLTHKEVKSYLDRFWAEVGEVNEVQVVFIPSFTSIAAFADALEESPNSSELGAQDMHWEQGGASTGEISAGMLQALRVKHVVIGHSERRQWFGESDAIVAKKTAAALAIGTGKTATAAQTQEAHAFIRSVLVSTFDLATAESVRIQYGGSVKPENAQALMAQKDVDGALVGAACLNAESFARIVQCAEKEQPTSIA